MIIATDYCYNEVWGVFESKEKFGEILKKHESWKDFVESTEQAKEDFCYKDKEITEITTEMVIDWNFECKEISLNEIIAT